MRLLEEVFQTSLTTALSDWRLHSDPPAVKAGQAFQLGWSLGRSGKALYWMGETAWAGLAGVVAGLLERQDGKPRRLPSLPKTPSQDSDVIKPCPAWYRWLASRLPAFNLPRAPIGPAPPLRHGAYFVWRHPPETFVQREIDNLRRSGLTVSVLAQEGTSAAPERLAYWTFFWLLHRPWAWMRVVGAVLACFSHQPKSWRRDRRTLGEIFWLAGQVRRLGIDHLHSPWANPCALVATAAARLAGCACSAKARAHELNRVEAPNFLPWLLPQLDGVATNSDWGVTQLNRLMPGNAPRIYNGLDPGWFPQPATRRSSCQPLRILSVARLVHPKGLDTLLRACAMLQHPFQCRLVGGLEEPIYTRDWIELRRLWKKLHLEPAVEFCGELDGPSTGRMYEWADVLVLPARVARDGSHDVTPNCIYEAMASRLPIITTPVGAIGELVEPEHSALWVTPDHPGQLARALERLAGEAPLRARLAENAWRRLQERFDGPGLAEQWLDFLQRAQAGQLRTESR